MSSTIAADVSEPGCIAFGAAAVIYGFQPVQIWLPGWKGVLTLAPWISIPMAAGVIWLSIKRRDKAPVHDWRDLQVIKNLIVGPEHEGFEIYPAESRLVDTANQYHVFVFLDPKVRLPVGFRTREVTGAEQAAAVGARQRDFHSAV